MNINFKFWLEGIEEYNPFKSRISQSAYNRNFVFDSWFPQERIYMPLKKDVLSPEDQKFQKELMELFDDHGFELVDLKQGYARQKGKTNLFKIGKLLNKIEFEEEKNIKSQFEQGQISKTNYESQLSY